MLLNVKDDAGEKRDDEKSPAELFGKKTTQQIFHKSEMETFSYQKRTITKTNLITFAAP
jgi:hypothetical protein